MENERYHILSAMNTLAKALNDESFYYNHWIYIIPDEADEEELLEIATDDVETFNGAVSCFNTWYGRYAKHGLAIG